MSDQSSSEMNSEVELEVVSSFLRKQKESQVVEDKKIEINGKSVQIDKYLGRGGSKNVYDVDVEGQSFALALPNYQDGVLEMRRKWEMVLNEPENTDRIRSLGLLTNPVCEKITVDIQGVRFPALKMSRYQDLPFDVLDGKNSYSSKVSNNVFPDEVDEIVFTECLEGVITDIETMIKNGVQVGSDSINIAVQDDKLRIYLNDLGGMKIMPISENEIQDFFKTYLQCAVSALINGFPYNEEWQKLEGFFKSSVFNLDNPNGVVKQIEEKRNINKSR